MCAKEVILTKAFVPRYVDRNVWFEIEIEGHVEETVDNPCIGVEYTYGPSEFIYYRVTYLNGRTYEGIIELKYSLVIPWKGTKDKCFELKVKKFELKIPLSGKHKLTLFAGKYDFDKKEVTYTDWKEFETYVSVTPSPTPTPTITPTPTPTITPSPTPTISPTPTVTPSPPPETTKPPTTKPLKRINVLQSKVEIRVRI